MSRDLKHTHPLEIDEDLRVMLKMHDDALATLGNILATLGNISPAGALATLYGFAPAGSGTVFVIYSRAPVSSAKAVAAYTSLDGSQPVASPVQLFNLTQQTSVAGVTDYNANGQGHTVLDLPVAGLDLITLSIDAPAAVGVNVTLLLLPVDSLFVGEISAPDYGAL